MGAVYPLADRRRIVTRGAAIGLTLALAAGCAAPTAPSTAGRRLSPGPTVDARLAPSWRILETLPAPPWAGGATMAAWIHAARIGRVDVGDLPPGYGAAFDHDDRSIVVSPAMLAEPVGEIAAFLAHEIRHADGHRHTCGQFKDGSEADGGAYAVQVWTLEHVGRQANADAWRAYAFCDVAGRDRQGATRARPRLVAE